MTPVVVRFENRGNRYAVTFTYDPLMVELLKLTVPPCARSWSRPRREWLVEAIYGRPLADAMRSAGATVVGVDDHPTRGDPADWARSVFRRVGPTRAPLAYRLLSRVCHPDHGGDHDLQTELNRAYAAIERTR